MEVDAADWSDYFSGSGSGSNSMKSSPSWGSSQELQWPSVKSTLLGADGVSKEKARSYADLVSGRWTVQDPMQEFRMNGTDVPYGRDDADDWRSYNDVPPCVPSYQRQQSWPAASRPRPILPAPAPRYMPMANMATLSANDLPTAANNMATAANMATLSAHELPTAANYLSKSANMMTSLAGGGGGMMPSNPVPIPMPNKRGFEGMAVSPPRSPQSPPGSLTAEQRRVLNSLPDEVVITLLREMQRSRRQAEECRFCKNNGEQSSYYRAHCLKDEAGRVQCPVLRAFVCKRCGARGDDAHTIKYCPYSTTQERIQSAAMMRSMRMASGRRRVPSSGGAENYVVFGETPASVLKDQEVLTAYSERAPAPALDPLWIALEQKLMLS